MHTLAETAESNRFAPSRVGDSLKLPAASQMSPETGTVVPAGEPLPRTQVNVHTSGEDGASPAGKWASLTCRLKMIHPARGQYDLVVTQSSAAPVLPEALGLMAGRQVHTVLLQVGDEWEWVLHYAGMSTGVISRWVIRSASRGGAPVEAETLLVIPARA